MAGQKRTRILAGIVGVPLFAMLCLVTIAASSGGSAGGTLRSGRTVVTRSDSLFLSSEFSADTATIRSGRRSIVVRPASLSVDGVVIASIDPDATDVRVTVADGDVAFVVDGQPVRISERAGR